MAAPAPILIADDEESDRVLLGLAVEEAGVSTPLVAVADGKEVIAYLNGDAPYLDRRQHPLPKLLLLDLKMPRKTGFDVLAWLAGRPDLKPLPVVVFTSSGEECDREKALEMGASDYCVKSQSFPQLVQLVRELHARWLEREP